MPLLLLCNQHWKPLSLCTVSFQNLNRQSRKWWHPVGKRWRYFGRSSVYCALLYDLVLFVSGHMKRSEELLRLPPISYQNQQRERRSKGKQRERMSTESWRCQQTARDRLRWHVEEGERLSNVFLRSPTISINSWGSSGVKSCRFRVSKSSRYRCQIPSLFLTPPSQTSFPFLSLPLQLWGRNVKKRHKKTRLSLSHVTRSYVSFWWRQYSRITFQLASDALRCLQFHSLCLQIMWCTVFQTVNRLNHK